MGSRKEDCVCFPCRVKCSSVQLVGVAEGRGSTSAPPKLITIETGIDMIPKFDLKKNIYKLNTFITLRLKEGTVKLDVEEPLQ